MTRFRPHRWLPLLRVFVLGLFALGLVLQPVTAAVGEMHELAHDPSGTHSHDLHADELDAELAAAGEQDQGGAKTLHVLQIGKASGRERECWYMWLSVVAGLTKKKKKIKQT